LAVRQPGAAMPWQVVERRIGRAGGRGRREARQRDRDRKDGEGNRAVGYGVARALPTPEEAVEAVYYRRHPEDFAAPPPHLPALLSLARALRNPHAEATSGVDLQTPAILAYLQRHGLELRGSEVVDVGTWNGAASHPLSVCLSPLQVRCCLDPKLSL